MDLAAIINNIKFKIRVAGILSTPKGFLFEKSDEDYIFPIGGKVMVNETSQEALEREVMEEIEMKIKNSKLCSVMENLYTTTAGLKIHEICFVYKIDDIFEGDLPDGFLEVAIEDIDKYKIKPIGLTKILKDTEFKHVIVK